MSQANLDQLNNTILTNLGPDVNQSTVDQIRKAFTALSDADQTQMLQTLSQAAGQDVNAPGLLSKGLNPFGSSGNQISEANLQSFLNTVTTNAGGTTTTPSSAQTAANTAPITSATAVGAQLSEKTDQGPSYGTAVMGTGATSFATGQPLAQYDAQGHAINQAEGFNEQLQAYYDSEFSYAGNDINQLAQLSGTDPQMLQQQYAQYQQGIATAKAQWTGHGALPDMQPPSMLTLPQFAQSKAQSMVGSWAAVMEAIGLVWQSQTESALPTDLAAQIITALNKMPSDQKQNVLYLAMQYMANAASSAGNVSVRDQTGSLTAAMLGALPSSILGFSGGTGGVGTGTLTTAGIVGTALGESPFLVKQQTTAAIQQAFESALHRAPTAADLAALGSNPTDIQIRQYIDAQPVPGTSMTYGTYSAVSNELTTQWQEYFGRDPTQKELLWAVGKSPEDITSFINNSQSSIPGLTIGRKNDYESFIDSLGTSGASSTTHAFSGTLDDSLIKDLHSQVTAASTGKASPGAM